MTESQLQVMVADYIILHYPNVLFHSDFGSGVKLTKGQAVRMKRQNGGRRGWPDMFIAESRRGNGKYVYKGVYHGLFLELKKEGTRLQKKDGSWVSEHITEQASVLSDLIKRGYQAEFAVGFEQAKEIIDDYLGGEE